jgi:hypothetical protein
MEPDMTMYACLSSGKVESGEAGVSGQPGLHSEIMKKEGGAAGREGGREQGDK